MEDKLYRAFSGSEVEAVLLQGELEENGISSTYRDGSVAGVSPFYGGAPFSVDLFINEADLIKAKTLIDEFLKNRESDQL